MLFEDRFAASRGFLNHESPIADRWIERGGTPSCSQHQSSSQIVPKWTGDPSASDCPRDFECIRIETGDVKRVGRLSSDDQLTYAPQSRHGPSFPVDRGRV